MNPLNVPQNKGIRTNESAEFIEGDVVVFRQEHKPGHLMTVHKVQSGGVLLDGNRNFALTHFIRSATTAELKAKRRLPAPATLFVPVDLSLNSHDEARHLHRALGAQGWVT